MMSTTRDQGQRYKRISGYCPASPPSMFSNGVLCTKTAAGTYQIRVPDAKACISGRATGLGTPWVAGCTGTADPQVMQFTSFNSGTGVLTDVGFYYDIEYLI